MALKPILWSQEVYLKAWNFACFAHKGQILPGSEIPYINHISSVAMEVMTAIFLEPVQKPDLAVQCALLHDTLEDTVISYEQLRYEFGPEVADGVIALTKNKSLATKTERMNDSLQRIKIHSIEIWMVKLADRITNLQPPPGTWSKEKKIEYTEEAKIISNELHTAHKVLSERLRNKINHYKSYAD
jgi:(p)ppGpp synthase/HD superfamily hydrolase